MSISMMPRTTRLSLSNVCAVWPVGRLVATASRGGELGDRAVVAVGLERGDGTVNERFDQFRLSAHRIGVRMAEGQEDCERRYGGGLTAVCASAW